MLATLFDSRVSSPQNSERHSEQSEELRFDSGRRAHSPQRPHNRLVSFGFYKGHFSIENAVANLPLSARQPAVSCFHVHKLDRFYAAFLRQAGKTNAAPSLISDTPRGHSELAKRWH